MKLKLQKFLINNISINSVLKTEIKSVIENSLDNLILPSLVTTFNLDFLRIAHSDIEFKNICQNSLFNLPDGFGITSLIKIKYKRKIERITGNDIFPIIIKIAKKKGLKVAIIGSSNDVSSAVNQKIISEFDFLCNNLLCLSPPKNFEIDWNKNNLVVQDIIEFKPTIVFAALGCPRQEKWLFKHMNEFGSKLNIGIGATLDYFVGEKKRSPKILQKFGLEWLWRLINEPKRLFCRYIVKDIPFYLKTIFGSKFRKNL